MNLFKKYECVKQHDLKDCGAACLATVARSYQLKIPISKIREVAGTDHRGTSVYGLTVAAEKLGFTVKAVEANKEAFFGEFPLPAIAHVVIDNKLLHYVVIHKITKNKVIIADPAKGIQTLSPQEFFDIWTNVLVLLVPSEEFVSRNETKSTVSRFIELLKPQKKLLTHIFLASLLYTVFGILGAFYFKYLIDEILPYQLTNTLHIVSIGVIVLYMFRVILNFFRSYLLLFMSQRLDISLIIGYYKHVLSLPMNFFNNRKVGEVVSRLMDASKVREAISSAALTIMIDILMILVGGAILFTQSKVLFAVTCCMIPFYIAIVWSFHHFFEKINREEMQNNAEFTSYIVESVTGIETVKSFHAEKEVQFETEKKFVSLIRSVFKHGNYNNIQTSLKTFVQLVGGVIILWVGSTLVIDGRLTIGQLITFNALLAYFLEPIQNLINLQPQMQSAVVATDRLMEIMDLDKEVSSTEDKKLKPDTLKGDILLQDVHFRFGTRAKILNGINMYIPKGKKVALVGESGSGKTSLVQLLVQFHKQEKGDIYINGVNIQDIQLETIRKKIAYITQDAFFFTGTIRENLMLGNDEATFDDIIRVCKITRVHDFVNNLPLRYDSIIEENGSNFSGGQIQRLAIARALLKNPDILIMDEATSNLDTTTEKAITETISSINGITTIIIAHRLSTIMHCDHIVVLNNGEVLEEGVHQELMDRKGKYYHLWRDQLPQEFLIETVPSFQ
ncbi:peptidase domain-containing ABC transporter [Metabacillus malikii]|uniref:ATP-binding cassette subfamily B protein n=1 Tax=Metabacillus malikii TaxID=1504265 RepID=A0ABT9ZHQ1_9BACI|nr:peptidase domain-containing ABC transporter [Metabacillus malikii]MDQ0230735.1 ATP-binding cassette subfamily B protein [Metabacillus malikii]